MGHNFDKQSCLLGVFVGLFSLWTITSERIMDIGPFLACKIAPKCC